MSEFVGLDVNEALRILIAVDERRLYRAKNGRFEIDGEVPPDRHTREALLDRSLVVTIYGNDGYRITPIGKGALDSEIADRVRAARAASSAGSGAGSAAGKEA